MNIDKFAEIGQVMKVSRNRFAPNDEGSIEVNINKTKLNCFVSEWENEFVENEKARIKLFINDTKVKKSDASEKRIIPKEDLGYYGYTIIGEVISLEENPRNPRSNLVVVDCGMKVFASVLKNIHVNLGDFIDIEGRLDAYKLD